MTGQRSHDMRQLPDWDGEAYAANTGHHRVFDDAFLAATPLSSGNRILDLGCGSGDFTATLAARVGPSGGVVGVDPQPSMLAEARARAHPNQSFVEASVQQLDEALGAEHDATFDLVLSRSALHWVPAADLPAVYRAAARLVRPGGFLRVECGGVGNVAATVALLDDAARPFGGPTAPWTFADPAQALDWVEQAGFDAADDERCFVRCIGQRRAFDEATLRGWLHSQVLQAYDVAMAPADRAAFRAVVDERIGELRRWDGTFDQTWVRLDLLVRRPAD